MANSLRMDLTGLVVIFRQEHMTVPNLEHPFRVSGGFGAKEYTAGRALFGDFLSDGEHARMEGYMVERLATDEEIDAALARRLKADSEKAVTAKGHRLWVNEERTVLFRFWDKLGIAEVATRESEDHLWAPRFR